MSYTSKYETIRWVLQLKQYGLIEFTRSQIPQQMFNASYFRTAIKKGYLKKIKFDESPNKRVFVWEIDEEAINNAHGLKRGLANGSN